MPDTVMQSESIGYRNRSSEIAKLASALCKAQAAMEGAKKDSENPHFKSSYADLDSVWKAVRKPLTDNGLTVVQFPRTVNNGVEIETTLLHSSGEFMCDVLWVPCSKNDAQGMGSAITYGRRYALMSVTGIAPMEDDGNAAAASHKPGAPGSAGGGGDFRPNGPRKFQGGPVGTPEAKAEAERDGLTGKEQPKAAPANGKKTPADKAKEWTDKAIQTISLPGQHVESLDRWWKDQDVVPTGAKFSPLGWLQEAAPTEYDRLQTAFDDARGNAKQVAA